MKLSCLGAEDLRLRLYVGHDGKQQKTLGGGMDRVIFLFGSPSTTVVEHNVHSFVTPTELHNNVSQWICPCVDNHCYHLLEKPQRL